MHIELPCLQDTEKLGFHLGSQCRAGEIITLDGSLGAGKTTLTQAIGRGLGVPPSSPVKSPTFSLLHIHPDGRLPLYHLDLYRLGGEEEIEELGFLDYLYGSGLSVIEWPDRLGSLMPHERLHLELHGAGEGPRFVEVTDYGERWRQRLAGYLP